MNVVLLGDSIRMNYQAKVRFYLDGVADVYTPDENCRWSSYTLKFLFTWFAAFPKDIDVVHWNNGLWDVSTVEIDNNTFSSIYTYMDYMSRILRILRTKTRKIIFATTTPAIANHIRNENVNLFNSVITDFMNKEGVPINDLNALITANTDKYLVEDGVHLSEAGMDACGKAVADKIIEVYNS
ncbi:MAG: SGNH/GDSL hydrolase family protein [Oscillospiraceae bacterium]|nr:SGNH/GDSL hydrolase family protein [Oscillospiraceae bacterium]